MTEDAELKAMTEVAAALQGLEGDTLRRVLQWMNSRYAATRIGQRALGRAEPANEGSNGDFQDVADLFAAARPRTDPERALVVGYWLQVHEGLGNIDAQAVNAELKNLGHPIGNITMAFGSLISRRPALAMQVKKQGTTKQARKKYRLTTAGLSEVERLLAGGEAGEAGGN